MKNKIFKIGGSDYVDSKIREAIENGRCSATITGAWEINREIRLPSGFTLLLEDCHLRMADGSFSNMFVNRHHGTELGRTTEGTDRDITIIGRGEAVLDGGKYNGLSERNWRDVGTPIWKNNLLLFTNVEGFHIEGIRCINQRWWALNFIFCRKGYIGNVDFCASDIGVDEKGNEYHGLVRNKYDEVLVKNADGIDLRAGCQDIVIENITGFTEDDSIALTGLNGSVEKAFSAKGLSSDICRVLIKNIRTAAFCTNVRLLNQGDVSLHDITIDSVYDVRHTCPHMDKGLYAVRVGDTRLYGTRHATKDETYNISIRKVYGAGEHVLSLAGEIGNLVVEDITAAEGTELILEKRATEAT